MIDEIRVSIGTAIVLGLKRGALPDRPTTAYLMVGKRCVNNCSFCTQAREAGGEADMLSRVSWPKYPRDRVIDALKEEGDKFGRVCFQCLNDPEMVPDLPRLIEDMRSASDLPVSVSIVPVSKDMMRKLKRSGAERIGIAMDASNPDLFSKIKGREAGNPYTFQGHRESLLEAIGIFGRGYVSTHIIVGMGESDKDVVELIRWCRINGIIPSLFSYTPMKGTRDLGPPPPVGRYRALQIVRHVIVEGDGDIDVGYDGNWMISEMEVPDRSMVQYAFMTRGCPMCNRPYYNERPGGDVYNYPRSLSEEEINRALRDVENYVGE